MAPLVPRVPPLPPPPAGRTRRGNKGITTLDGIRQLRRAVHKCAHVHRYAWTPSTLAGHCVCKGTTFNTWDVQIWYTTCVIPFPCGCWATDRPVSCATHGILGWEWDHTVVFVAEARKKAELLFVTHQTGEAQLHGHQFCRLLCQTIGRIMAWTCGVSILLRPQCGSHPQLRSTVHLRLHVGMNSISDGKLEFSK